MDQLNSVGFVWQACTCTVPWIEMYRQLRSFQTKHGGSTICVPVQGEFGRVGRWVNTQRHYYRAGKILNEIIALLESIGLRFIVRGKRRDWGEMYQRLLAYHTKHGTAYVPKNYHADPQLANWCKKQRYRCRSNRRKELLNKIGLVCVVSVAGSRRPK